MLMVANNVFRRGPCQKVSYGSEACGSFNSKNLLPTQPDTPINLLDQTIGPIFVKKIGIRATGVCQAF